MKNIIRRFFTFGNIFLIITFLIFFIFLRWNMFTAPFERDEGVYAYSAWLMRKGIMPYEFSFPYKPPMIIYIYMLSQMLFGEVIWGPRVLLALASLAVILFTFLISYKTVGRRAAWISAWLLAVMLILPVNFGNGEMADVYYAAVTEIFMLLPAVIFVYLYVLMKEKANYLMWFISGILFSLSVMSKPISPLIFIFVYLLWLLNIWRKKKDITEIIIKTLFALIGFMLMSLLILLPFLIYDGGMAMWKQMFGFSTCFVSMGSNDFSLRHLIQRIFIMGKYYWALYVFILYYIYKKPVNSFLFLGLLIISFLSVYYSLIGHYFLQVIPFLAIASAHSIDLFLIENAKIGKYALILIVVILLTIIYPIRNIFGKTPQELSLLIYNQYDPFYEAQLVGKKISEITNPNDYIYVEGPDPEIVYFAQRRNAVRMEWTDFMNLDCKAIEGYQEQYIKDIKNNSPEVITLCIYGSCGYLWKDEKAKYFTDFLLGYVDGNYTPVGGWIPKKNGGYWLEPISKNDIPYARTVIYKRKH